MSFWQEITKGIDIAKSKIKSLPVYATPVKKVPARMEFRVGEGLNEQQTQIAKEKIATPSGVKPNFWANIKKQVSPREEAVSVRRAFEITPVETKAPPIITGAATLGFSLLEAIPRAAATIGGEFANKFKPGTVKANIDIRRLGFETPEYVTAAKEQQDAINNGENPWISGLRIASSKTLDVAFGASLMSDLAKLSTKILVTGPMARTEAKMIVDTFKTQQKGAFARLKNAPLEVREKAMADMLNVKKQAEKILKKEGLPTKLDKARVNASRYTEVLGRETSVGKGFWSKIMNPDVKLKVPGSPNIAIGEMKQLPGTRERPGQAPAFGLSARELESVGGAKAISRAVEDYKKASVKELADIIANDKKILSLVKDPAMKRVVTEQIRRGEAELARRNGVKENPLETEARKYKSAEEFVKEKHPGVDFSIYEKGDEITLLKIVVPKDTRGAGIGTKAMEDLISFADIKGKRILLTPSKDYGASSISRLTDFYKKFGFVENKGRARDFSTREAMIREPRTDIYNKAVGKTKAPEGYKGEKDLTTKILKDLEGKTTVSKQYILDATNRGELKQVERDLIRDILERETPKVLTKDEMIKRGAGGHLNRAVEIEIPLSKIDGKEPTPAMEGGYKKGIPITQPIEVRYEPATDKYMLYAGNHRVTQAEINGQKTIKAFVENAPKSDTINVSNFAKKVKAELLPLTSQSSSGLPGGANRMSQYENITLPQEIRGKVKDYGERIYGSPVKTSAGKTHFGQKGGLDADNYFGHTRIEDMADNKTRRVIEVQSDLYQKGRLEKETPRVGQFGNGEYGLFTRDNSEPIKVGGGKVGSWKTAEQAQKYADTYTGVDKLKQYNDPTAHFRMVREEIKKAAQDGKTKLQFPTGETAMKIEGLGQHHDFIIASKINEGLNARTLTVDRLKVGEEVINRQMGSDKWIITDVLGDGKFKAVQKSHIKEEVQISGMDGKKITEQEAIKSLLKDNPQFQETFDISGKVDTNNPIYKFYEKDMGRYLTNKYGAKTVIDDKGVSWYEVPIKEEYGEGAIEAFGAAGGIEQDDEGNIRINPIKAAFGIAGFSLMKKSGVIKTAEELIAAGKIRVTSLGNKSVFQIKEKGVWVNVESASKAVKKLVSSSVDTAAERAIAGEDFGPRDNYKKAIEKKIEDVNEAKQSFDIYNTDPLEDVVKAPVSPEILQDITERATVGSFAFKPVASPLLQFRDPLRNFEAFFGPKHFPEIKETFLDPFDTSKGKFVDTQKELAEDLFTEITEKLGIKKGSPESAAVMNYGERNLQGDFATAEPETEYSLISKFGREKAANIIKADAYFRKKYNELIDRTNEGRKKIYGEVWAKKKDMDSEIELLQKNIDKKKVELKGKEKTDTLAYNKLRNQTLRMHRSLWARKQLMESDLWWRGKIIPKRNDYYRHYFELAEGFKALKNILTTDAEIPTQLAGISTDTKPKSKFLEFAQARTGNKSERDAVGAFLNYIPSASYAIHIDPHIESFRKLAEALRQSENKSYSPFIEYLTDYANDLAGKTSGLDRGIQKITGRKVFRVINWLNNRVKANTILANVSSSIAQIFNVPQSVGSAKQHSIKGATRSFAQIFGNNVPMSESTFIKERFAGSITDKFDTSWLKKPKKFALFMLTALDEVGTKFIWNSHYEKALAEKIPNPVKYADDMARKMVAGRGVGEVPLVQKSKVFQFFAPFQLEVANSWWVMKDFVNKKDFSGIVLFFVTAYLMNRAAEEIRGSDVVFDPIQAMIEGLKTFANEEDKARGATMAGGRVAGEVISNIPLGQSLAALYPEYGWFGSDSKWNFSREELFGKGDPTRFGGGLISIKGLQDPLFKILPPFGGSQLKKTLEGAEAVKDGAVYNKGGNLIFQTGTSKASMLKALLFGKYSSEEAQEYFNRAELNAAEFRDIRPVYEKAQALIKEENEEEAQNMIDGLSDEEYELYKQYRTKAKTLETFEGKKAMTPKYLEIQKINKKDPEKAKAMIDAMTDDEYKYYGLVKKQLEKDKKAASGDKPEFEDGETAEEEGVIKTAITYGHALGVDPVTAFNRIFTGQRIRYVTNGTVIVERMSVADSQEVKEKRAGKNADYKLDHLIPLQLGGSNAENNLIMVPTTKWEAYTPVENFLGKLLRDKKITKKKAQDLITKLKTGEITSNEVYQQVEQSAK